jgi:AraC-like DNA-binding protein
MAKRTRQTHAFISKQVLNGRYFFSDPKPSAGNDFSLVCAGREECLPDYRIHRSGFRYHAIELVVSGTWSVAVSGKNYKLGPGSAFAYGPETPYEMNAKSPSGLVKYFADFEGSRSTQMLAEAGFAGGRPVLLTHSRWFQDIFDEILAGAEYRKGIAHEMGTLWARLVLLRLKQERRTINDRHTVSYDTFLRCRRHLRENFSELRSVDQIASACRISPAYLSRLFMKYSDEGPRQFLTRLKIDHAAALLQRSRVSVKEAASLVGFDDPYHFSRNFKKQFGIAPAHFTSKTGRG